MALDEARGLLYLPTSTPSSDYYGGQRHGANLFAESLVCLDAATGKDEVVFPDRPPRPVGLRQSRAAEPGHDHGRTASRIDAVAQVTKQGFTYVFDRVTGKPVWPIVERPVPTDSDVPGESSPMPTQPISHQAAGRSSSKAYRSRTPTI